MSAGKAGLTVSVIGAGWVAQARTSRPCKETTVYTLKPSTTLMFFEPAKWQPSSASQ